MTLHHANAREISGAEFFRTIFGDHRGERDRQMREQCISAIGRGDTYGWPPAMVEECRKLSDAREENRCKCDEQLTECRGDPLLKRRAA